jgi:hypothetical protein
MKKYLFIILIVSLSLAESSQAQLLSINGTINDTINKQKLHNTSISILKAKDSTLIKFTRSNKEGNFEIKDLPAGEYVAMITHPTYADYYDKVVLAADKNADLGTISMTLKSRLLQEVFVKQTIAAIRLKGDTIEYKADSFKVREGASVEEMLRKLPGLQVDKDGNITAQGTKVEKVLVDGEEFFGDDPTMATKNLQADAIDKVQVFDKKSDQAAFTGIDDGTKIKTLNLTMKEDKKKGYFGKVELASGPDNRWNNNLMLNSFRAKKKLSAYGIMSSTGKTGLNWQEAEKFGAQNNMQYDADGGYFYSSGGGDEFDSYGSYYGQGLPTSWSGGLHFSNKFNADKQNFNSSYRYNKLNTEGGGNTFSQSILPDTLFFNRETRDFSNTKQRHAVNGTYEWQLDSFTSIKVIANGYVGDSRTFNTFGSEAINGSGNLVNSSNRFTSAVGTNRTANSNILIRRKFKKIGRTISLSFDQQFKNNDNDGTLYSINRFFGKTGAMIRTDTIDQRKVNDVTNAGYYSRIAYTEPIVKNVFMELSYGIRVSQSESKKLSYDKSGSDKYDVINDTFSNHYDFNVVTNSGGMTWRYNGKKITAAAGGDVAFSDFKQKDVLHNTLLEYNYRNFFPRSNFAYKFNTNSRITLNYNGNTRQPSIEQLQPIRDNYNPLNISVGNPDLKQEFRHMFSLNYNSYKVLSQRGFYSYANFTTVSNAITNSDQTDTLGRRVFKYINVNGNYSGYSGGGYNMKLQKIDVNLNFGFNVSLNHNNTVVNSRPNVTDNNSYGLNFSVSKYKEKKFDVRLSSNVKYNMSKSSIRPDVATNYYTQNYNFSFNYNLPFKFEINSDVDANFRQKTSTFDDNNNTVVWNGYIGRKLFKNDKGLIKIQANDILDQNRGYNRYINSNIIREDNYQSLRRYFLLSFVWNFSKSPAGLTPEN